MTTPDEREALARILDKSDPEMGGVVADEGHESWEWYLPQVDAILAAGYRLPQPEPTDAEVETAQEAFHEFAFGDGEPLTPRDKGITRLAWKYALTAARKAAS